MTTYKGYEVHNNVYKYMYLVVPKYATMEEQLYSTA